MMKKSICLIFTTILSTSIIGGGILAYTNTSVDKVSLLNRAVQDDKLGELKNTRADMKIELGKYHSGAIVGGELYMWGLNTSGQLGLGDSVNAKNIPTKVTNTSSGPITEGLVTQLALADENSGAIIDGELYMWGHNGYGQLGIDITGTLKIPTKVTNTSSGPISKGSVTQLACSSMASGAIIGGELYMWGKNGLGNNNNQKIPTKVTNTSSGPISKDSVTQLAMGKFHSGAIIGGELYMWGSNSYGELGLGNSGNDKNIPTKVTNTSSGPISKGLVTQLALGEFHSGAIIGGELYMWGYNFRGKLGLGNTNNQDIPTKVTNTSSGPISKGLVTQLALAAENSGAIIDGELYMWGGNDYGQLGLGSTGNKDIPTKVKNTSSGPISKDLETKLVLGYNHSGAIIDGELYIWGSNDNGQLGLGSTGNKDIPTKITTFPIIINKNLGLDDTNDPGNILRNDIVYNIDNDELKTFIEKSKASIGIPTGDTYLISDTKFIGRVDVDNKGQITTKINVQPSNTTINLTIKGFKPVNITQNAIIAEKTIPTGTIVPSGEINDLVTKANDDTTGKASVLAKWIINNQSIIVGDTSTTNTVDLPKDTKISKVEDFMIVDATKGKISFKIYVDKYYEASASDPNLNISTSVNPIKLTNIITLSGFKATTESTIAVIAGTNRDLNAKQLLDSFGYKNDLTAITEPGLSQLKIYLTDLDNFPKDTTFNLINPTSIVDQKSEKVTLAFKIKTNKYFHNSGIQVNSDKTFNPAKLEIDGLNDASSKIERNGRTDSTINATQLLEEKFKFVDVNTAIVPAGITEMKKYLDGLDNFPTNTSFKIIDPVKNGTELSFKISADKYYDPSGTTNTTSKTFPNSGTFSINNLLDSSSKDLILKKTTSTMSTPDEILKDMGYSEIKSTTGKVTKDGLLKYFSKDQMDTFPFTAEYTLININKEINRLSFQILASKYFDAAGETQDNKLMAPTYAIDVLGTLSTNIQVKKTYNKDILSGDLAKSFGYVSETEVISDANLTIIKNYVDFLNEAPGATYTMKDLVPKKGQLSLTITASDYLTNSKPNGAERSFKIIIDNLKIVEDSKISIKNTINGDGTKIAKRIETEMAQGKQIPVNDPLLNQLFDKNEYPADTVFTVNRITPVNKKIFKTFTIELIADKYYSDQTTKNNQRTPLAINNLKFAPTTEPIRTNKEFNIETTEFATYFKYDKNTGICDFELLQEYIVLNGFDLDKGATKIQGLSIDPDTKQINFELVVTHYVGTDGIGIDGPKTFTASLPWDLPIPPVADSQLGITYDAVIWASSIAGSLLFLILLILLISLLIHKKRNQVNKYLVFNRDDKIEKDKKDLLDDILKDDKSLEANEKNK